MKTFVIDNSGNIEGDEPDAHLVKEFGARVQLPEAVLTQTGQKLQGYELNGNIAINVGSYGRKSVQLTRKFSDLMSDMIVDAYRGDTVVLIMPKTKFVQVFGATS